MRNADLTLSGDRDGNGSTDDNVRANALDVIARRYARPALGSLPRHRRRRAHLRPGHAEESAAITEVDAAVGDILAAIPPDTLVMIFADHGMHAVQEDGRWATTVTSSRAICSSHCGFLIFDFG